MISHVAFDGENAGFCNIFAKIARRMEWWCRRSENLHIDMVHYLFSYYSRT